MQTALTAREAEAEKHLMHIQTLELRLQAQSRTLETRHWDANALKEEVAKLQGQAEISQSFLDVAQEQSRRYSEQLQASQRSLRFERNP